MEDFNPEDQAQEARYRAQSYLDSTKSPSYVRRFSGFRNAALGLPVRNAAGGDSENS